MKLSLKRRCSIAALLARDVAVLDVDLRGLREARELLVGRLGRDDARRVGPETGEPHGEAAGIERMELHEARPGFVEQDVVAEMADALRGSSRRCRSCRHRCTARRRRRGTAAGLRQASGSLTSGWLRIFSRMRVSSSASQRIGPISPQALRSVGDDRSGCRRRSTARRDAPPCDCCGRTARGRRRRPARRAPPCWRSRCR